MSVEAPWHLPMRTDLLSRTCTAPGPILALADGKEVEWQELEKSDFPKDVMVQARRPATRWIYNYTWPAFWKWASNQSIDPFKSSYKDVVLVLCSKHPWRDIDSLLGV